MKLHSSCFGISGFLAAVSLFALKTAALPSHSRGRPAYLVLAGDSTTAGQSAGGGGWGDGFLNTTLRYPASGRNFGHNGATTVSFVQGGDWAAVLEDVESHVDSHKVFVTIQVSLNSCQSSWPNGTDSFSLAIMIRKRPKTSACPSTPPTLASW